MTYLDSSALIKLYYHEAETPSLAEYVRDIAAPIGFSHLHSLEIRNALRLKVFRKETSSRDVKKALDLIDLDLTSGVLLRPYLNWFDVFRESESLSRAVTSGVGTRALDLLHIASALLLEADGFLTFDDRQAAAAKKAGLDLVKWG